MVVMRRIAREALSRLPCADEEKLQLLCNPTEEIRMTNRVANTVLALALLGAPGLAQDQEQSRTVASVTVVPAESAPSTTSLRYRRMFRSALNWAYTSSGLIS